MLLDLGYNVKDDDADVDVDKDDFLYDDDDGGGVGGYPVAADNGSDGVDKTFSMMMTVVLLHFRTVKVDCITVSTSPVKSTIDDHIQQLFDALLNTLRRSIINDVQTIDTFLTTGMESLSTRPQTVEEIGEANLKHSELSQQKPQVGAYDQLFPGDRRVNYPLLHP